MLRLVTMTRICLHWSFGVMLWCCLVRRASAAVEGFGMDPINMNGFEIGELSVPQYLFFMLVCLQLILLYAVGVLPLEFDFGGVLGSQGLTLGDSNSESVARSFVTSVLKHENSKGSLICKVIQC